ncbi:Gfo/Idh/MocA family oxidoreductase [Streptomyces sp. NPDC006386]|uniref:Gfo/Idh/MocA family protein n=1 Tax=Streptomyces sp. NPDC006386 TaxID=3156762 RepID=UPI0033B447BE
MKIGIIGAGGIALAHLRAAETVTGVEAAGVYDVMPDKAAELAGRFGCAAFSSTTELYERVDAVVIASPNHTHADYAEDAVRHGRHVLCEKPMTTTVAEAERITALAEESGLVCAMGFNYRYLDAIGEIRNLVRGGELGSVLFAEAGFRRGSALTRSRFTWRDSALGRSTSGSLGDLGVHLVDMLDRLFDSPVDSTSCRTKLQVNVPQKEGQDVQVDDYAFVSGLLENGTFFNLTTSKSSLPEELGFSLKIIGDRKELYYHSKDDTTYFLKSRVTWEQGTFAREEVLASPPGEVPGWSDTFRHQLREWRDAVTAGDGGAGRSADSALADFGDGLRSQRVLERLLTGDQRYALAAPVSR